MSIPPDDDLGTEIPEDDLLGALREQFDEDDISKQPTGPLREPETDFMFGDLPDRPEPPKREKAPPQASSEDDSSPPEPSPGIPDWLSHAAEPKGAASPTIPSPGWLGHAGAPQPPSPPSADVPDWLSSHTPSPDAKKPGEPSIDEALDWLTDSQIRERAAAQPESIEEEEVDRGGEQAGAPVGLGEDLSDLAGDSSVEVKPADEDDVLDWLREPIGVIDESDELEDTREWPDESPGEDDLFKDAESPGEAGEDEQEPEEKPGGPIPEVFEDQSFGEETPALDWLRALDEPGEAAPPPEAEQPAETVETPDWMQALDDLGDNLQPEGQSADDEEVPDWLSELDEQHDRKRAEAAAPQEPQEPVETPAAPSPLISSGMPDWLKAAEKPEPEAAPEPPSAIGEEKPVEAEESAPGWLAGLGVSPPPTGVEAEVGQETAPAPDWLQELGSAEPDQPLSVEKPIETPEELETPDWMAELEEISPVPDEPAADREDAAPPPDWLQELEGTEPEQTPSEEKRVEEKEIPEEVEAPDWMAELGGVSPTPDEQAVESEEAAPAPDWLLELGTDETGQPPSEEKPVEEKEAVAEEEAASVPDWMAELGAAEPDIVPADKVPPVEDETPEKVVEAPDWLASLAEPEPEAPPVGDQKKDDFEPDWLSELSAAESRPQEGEETIPAEGGRDEAIPDLLGIEPASEPVKEVEPDDWFKAFDQALDDLGPAAVEGEDLLGLAGGLLSPEEPAEEKEEVIPAADMGEIPEWLSGFGAVAASPVVEQPSIESGELAKQIQDLRFEAITGKSEIEEPIGPEKVGALKDMAGVIQPELIFDGTTLSTTEPLDRLVITEDQVAQIEIVKKLLGHEKGEAAPDRHRQKAPVLRLGIVLLLFVVVGAVLFGGISILPEAVPADNVVTACDIVDEIGSSSGTVLAAFEYGPDTAGELQPLAEAVLTHLAGYDDVVVYGISTQPVGPAQAQEAFTSAGGGDGWINLGYISGRASGVSGLTIGTGPGMVSPMSFDYLGDPTALEATRLIDADIDLIVVISSEIEDVRMWIEQAGTPTGIPVLAAVSVRAEPLAKPYQASGQLAEVISGIGDAVSYNRQAGDAPGEALLSVWNAQAVGSAVIAAIIVIGGVVSGLSTMRSHRELD